MLRTSFQLTSYIIVIFSDISNALNGSRHYVFTVLIYCKVLDIDVNRNNRSIKCPGQQTIERNVIRLSFN